jgi:tetratricopeptide (TPR) repeat protein
MPFAATVDADAPAGAGASLWLGEAAAVLLTERLATLGVPTFSRDDRVAAFARLQLPMSSALTRATMLRVAELIGAGEVVFGEVHLGGALTVQARRIQLDLGREQPAVTDESPLTDLVALFARVGDRLAGPASRTRPAAAAIEPLPLAAFEPYIKGLVAATPAAQQRFLETAERVKPRDPRVLMALWNVYSIQGFHEKALAMANAVAADSPLARKSRFAVARSLIELKRLDGAFQELSALDAARRTAPISNALGVVQIRRNILTGPTSALTYFTRAVNAEPDNTDYLFNLGYAEALAQRPTDALSWLREAVRFDAADGDAHLVMSAVLQGAGRTAEAQRELDLARTLGTSQDSDTLVLGTRIPPSLERIGDSIDGSPTLRLGALIAAPGQSDQRETAAFHLAHARDLIAQNNDREAAGELRRAIYLSPYEDEPHLLLGEIDRRAGQIDDAIDEFKVALWCRETAAGHVALGSALLDSGDRTAARAEATRAAAMAPTSPDVRALLDRLGPP